MWSDIESDKDLLRFSFLDTEKSRINSKKRSGYNLKK